MATLSETAVGCLQSLGTYALLRGAEELENVRFGQDLDILVADVEAALESFRAYYELSLAEDYDLAAEWFGDRVHLDLMVRGEIALRLDLIEGFSSFSRLSIRPSFKIDLMVRRTVVQVCGQPVFAPALRDELTMRYFEFMEYFDTRPDKVKHLDYIVDKLEEVSGERFFDAVHRYVGFPAVRWSGTLREEPSDASVRTALRAALRALWTLARCLARSLRSRAGAALQRLVRRS